MTDDSNTKQQPKRSSPSAPGFPLSSCVVLAPEFEPPNLEAKEFRVLLLGSIDDVIRGVLGDEPMEAMFSRLEKSFNVRHEEIPDRLDDFQTALGKMCGKGALVLTRMIARNLCNKTGGCSYHERSDWNLKTYVEDCKRRYGEES